MRYSDKQKADVVAYVKKYNQENGRGGQSAAKEKFNISPISIANWLTAAGEDLPGKGGGKKSKSSAKGKKGRGGRPKGSGKGKAKSKRGRKKGSTAPSAPSALSDRIQRLAEIDREMRALQAEFDQLKASL